MNPLNSCQNCEKLTGGSYRKNIQICAKCKEVLKIDMAMLMRGEIKIYLSELNRNKHGRKPSLTETDKSDIGTAYRNGESMGKLAKRYKVSTGTIWNALH